MSKPRKFYVSMTDKFMSGWGRSEGMTSRYVIECATRGQAEAIYKAAEDRPEMKRLSMSSAKPKARASTLYTWKMFEDLSGPWLEYYRKPAHGLDKAIAEQATYYGQTVEQRGIEEADLADIQEVIEGQS